MDDTCVSLQGKIISEEQIRILIGLDSEIVLALDKDVDINEIRHMTIKEEIKKRCNEDPEFKKAWKEKKRLNDEFKKTTNH